jgi:hypothetical protein
MFRLPNGEAPAYGHEDPIRAMSIAGTSSSVVLAEAKIYVTRIVYLAKNHYGSNTEPDGHREL